MQKKKIINVVVLFIIFALVISGACLFLQWNKYSNKKTLFKKYEVENNKTVYLLGTIGKRHFDKINHYSMNHMVSVIENVNPDITMIQARNDHYYHYGVIDGNIDACVAYSYCAENKIPTVLIDWWIIDNIYPKYATTNLRDDNVFIKISRAIKDADADSTLLVTIDSKSFYEQKKRFEMAGYKEVSIEDKSDYFEGKEEKFQFPAVVSKAWRDRTYYLAYNFPTEINNTKCLSEETKKKFIDMDHDKFYLQEIKYCKYLNNDILFKD